MRTIFGVGLKKCSAQLGSKYIATSPYAMGMQLQAIRFMSGRRDCNSKDHEPRCSAKNIAANPCMERKKKEAADKSKRDKNPFKSMWENPECCRDPCPDLLPRFDELYYQPSDKAKRKYQKTWAQCPKRKIVPKVVCEFEKIPLPPIKRRKKCDDRPKTATCVADNCGNKGDKKSKCLRINLPGCRPARVPPKCHITRLPTSCKKVCCQYPAFSECSKDAIRKGRPTECDCLRARSACSMWDYLRKMTMQKSANKG